MTKSSRWIAAGATTAVVDGLFAVVLSQVYGSTVTRLWQGVASVLLGKSALEGGTRTALIGVAMHVCVAFFWSGVFLALHSNSSVMRNFVERRGTLATAAIYGPFIWLVMSLAVIPILAHRPPNITVRWWINLIGHAPFVGFPIVWWIAGWRSSRDADRRAAASA